MIFAHQSDGIAQRFYDTFRSDFANRALPVADTDQAAFGGDALQVFITNIALASADAMHPGVGNNHRAFGNFQHIVDHLRRGMRHIDDDLEPFQLTHHLPAEFG